MHYSKETKKLVSWAVIVASLVTITPMSARAAQEVANRVEAEHQEETEVQLSPVITLGESRKAKTASMSDAIWKAPQEEAPATASDAFAVKSAVVTKGKKGNVATASNATQAEKAEVATESNAMPAEEAPATASNAIPAVEQPVAQKLIPLGIFKTTGYCSCRKCSGPWGGRTATGARVQERHTVAVDPRRIPYGTQLLINGITYTAEDCGSGVKGKHIDIYYGNHRTAQAHGLQRAEVFMVI